jgi:hypothetical protein
VSKTDVVHQVFLDLFEAIKGVFHKQQKVISIILVKAPLAQQPVDKQRAKIKISHSSKAKHGEFYL